MSSDEAGIEVKSRAAAWVRGGILSICLACFIPLLDGSVITSLLEDLSLPIVCFSLLLCMLQQVLAAARLRFALRVVHYAVSYRDALRSQFVGALFSQSLFAFVAGDAMRAWMLHRFGVPLRDGASAVLLDRMAGFIGLTLLVLGVLPVLAHRLPPEITQAVATSTAWAFVAIAVLTAIGFRCRHWASFRLGRLYEQSGRYLHLSLKWRSGSTLLIAGVAVQVLNIAIVFALIRALSIPVDLLSCVILVPPVMLTAVIPISIGGWGIRDGAMVIGLGLLGVDASSGVLVSALFGIALAITSLPGAVIYMHGPRPRGTALANHSGNGRPSISSVLR